MTVARMRRNLLILLLLFVPAVLWAQDGTEAFKLSAGDFRSVEFNVRQVPAEVDCSYQVVDGEPTVHAELLPRSEFRLMYRGQDHESMAATPAAASGRFRQLVASPGRYVLVLMNEPGAKAARVTLELRTTLNPRDEDMARGLDPRRRLTVILISFAVFFVTTVWIGRKLLRVLLR